MLNLTEISITTRKLALWLFILFIIYLILRFLTGLAIVYWKAAHPIPIPPPDVRFNKLPAPKFVSSASTSGFKFTLDNIDGKPPETTAAGKVYFMPKKLPTLLSPERTRNFAAKLEFTSEPQIISSTLFKFIDPIEDLRSLELDTVNINIKLRYDYRKNPDIFPSSASIVKKQAEDEIKSFTNSIFDGSILQGKTTSELLIYDGNLKKFVTATSVSSANALKVNYFRPDLDGLKVLPPLFNSSYIYAIYSPSPQVKSRMLEIMYTFWPIAFDDFATYPLRSGLQAWQDLLDGYATVINMGNNSPENIIIRNIYLAYYDSEEPQQYLQPIFVFEGDNNFVAFLPAISREWLE